MKKKTIRYILIGLAISLLSLVYYASVAILPVISGYGAKQLCSAVFLQGRDAQEVISSELSDFPLSLGRFKVNYSDSTTTGSVLGLGKRKAVYREGFGACIANDISVQELRKQQFNKPKLSPISRYHNAEAYWPIGERQWESIADSSIDLTALNQLMDTVFHGSYENKPMNTQAVLVVHRGRIVAERYAKGLDENSLHLCWSDSKSVLAAIVGAAEYVGHISTSDSMLLPEWKDSPKATIQIKHLLQQNSGLEFVEDYTSSSHVTRMLFSSDDMGTYSASLDLIYAPGEVFNYSGGNSNILSLVLRHKLGDSYHQFPYTNVFNPIGAESFVLETDASGTFVGSSYFYCNARDMAKLGLLHLWEGEWNGQRIFADDWVIRCIQPSSADERQHLGYSWWLNGFDEEGNRWYQGVPEDMYFADGYHGQNLFIIPSMDLVVVRFGLNNYDDHWFIREVVKAINPVKNQDPKAQESTP